VLSLKQLSDEIAGSAQILKERATKSATTLSTGVIDDSSAATFTAQLKDEQEPTGQIPVKRGDVIQLSITARGNHGADTTVVEFVIAEIGGSGRQ